MAGIYIHIPFCKQACHYCNFHFSTSLRLKNDLLGALHRELELRASFLDDKTVESVYFGGGTPSLLEAEELKRLLETIDSLYDRSQQCEMTIEANPDDLTVEKATAFVDAGLNRMSLGVQSFRDDDLEYMNRVHSAADARRAVDIAVDAFPSVSIDLIYGTPTLSHDHWKGNLATASSTGIQHVSAYALTVEEKTALHKFISKGERPAPDETQTAQQYEMLLDDMPKAGFEQYEISNFAKPGFISRHNSSYWRGQHYLGIGPSAHSFNGHTRSWNVANNALYVKRMNEGSATDASEVLSSSMRANELIMTGLRTKWGCPKKDVRELLDESQYEGFSSEVNKLRARELIEEQGERLLLTRKGKLLGDWVISQLFV